MVKFCGCVGILYADLEFKALASIGMDIKYYLKYAQGLAREIIVEKYMCIDDETRGEINECAFKNPVLLTRLNDYNNKNKSKIDPILMAEVFPHTLLVLDLLESTRKQAFDNTLQRIIDSTMIGIPLNFIDVHLIHNMMNLRLRQMALERKAVEMEKEGNMEKLMNILNTDGLKEKASVSGALAAWAEKMKVEIEKVTEDHESKTEKKNIIFPKNIPADKLASAAVVTVLKYLLNAYRINDDNCKKNLTKEGDLKVAGLVMQLAKTFENVYNLAQSGHYQNSLENSFEKIVTDFLDSKHKAAGKKGITKKVADDKKKASGRKVKLTDNKKLKIGAFLMTKVIDTLKFNKKHMVQYKSVARGKYLEGILVFKGQFLEDLIVTFKVAVDDSSRCGQRFAQTGQDASDDMSASSLDRDSFRSLLHPAKFHHAHPSRFRTVRLHSLLGR
eukprot:TRINITY_DN7879_c0_g2_i3.p1 TRINITY_DN7879_c0_g2~~TRINITY_DN7879_c0_g2_i3.p1  ORF type:complete len:445 (+),score=72.51 TRINITY_DN7879_c0_g2_i3:1317-2651(+)